LAELASLEGKLQPDTPVALAAPPASVFPWKPILWFGLLLIALFAPVLYGMVKEYITMEEMGHGIFVPFLAGYIVWKDREKILAQPVRGSWWGLFFLLWGFAQLVAGVLGADFFIARTAFLISLAGVIILTAGWRVLRAMFFPFVLLLFLIRLPLFIYSQITFPLQILASTLAEEALTLLGIPVFRDGNVLELASQRLSVVEACSGIRSLMSLGLLSLVYGYFFDTKKWMPWVLLVLSVPIAIVANGFRVTLTGIISEYKKEFAEGFYHSFEGWVIFLVALATLVLVHQLINLIYRFVTKRKAA
jgi:exosortase